jgi:hypothetical protein
MRNDMTKVIVEHPRHVAKEKHRARPALDAMAPGKMSLARSARERGGEKNFGDYLSPLHRYLGKHVGRPWNLVFSEITANLTGSPILRQHLRGHLWEIVKRDPGTYHGVYGGRYGLWSQPFYIDPRNGLLKRTASLVKGQPSAKRKIKQSDKITLTDRCELRRVDGIWFEIGYEPVPVPEYVDGDGRKSGARFAGPPSCSRGSVDDSILITPQVRDVLTGAEIAAGPERDEPSAWLVFRKQRLPKIYAMRKRQLSSAELRRHALANGL